VSINCPSIFGARAVDGLPRPRKCGVFVVQDRVHKRATGSKRGPIFLELVPGPHLTGDVQASCGGLAVRRDGAAAAESARPA